MSNRSYEELKELIRSPMDLDITQEQREWSIRVAMYLLKISDEMLISLIRTSITEYAARMAGGTRTSSTSRETTIQGIKEVIDLLRASMEGLYDQ